MGFVLLVLGMISALMAGMLTTVKDYTYGVVFFVLALTLNYAGLHMIFEK